jgi:hypothetical protein
VTSKKNYLQQFDIIHLPNLNLTYIRNPERETKLCVYPPPLENLNQELRKKLFYTDAPWIAARIYARAESDFPDLG